MSLALSGATIASAAPTTPLGHSGRWITDAEGRVVLFHGVNMVYKRAPFHPSAAGFDEQDAAFLREHGFNTVRLGITYGALEPQPGVYDDAYLDQVAATESMLADHGIFSQLDFHQDMYNPRFQGNGFPDWAVQDDGLPAQPQLGFPANYAAMPALWRAYDHFWANDPAPDGIGLQDHYAAAFRRVAERFRSAEHTLGYDLMNEPWPGTVWPTCALPILGCPLFDSLTLAAFHERVRAQIRAVEPQKLVWYEPNVIFNFGVDSHHPPTGDEASGFSFHVYCLPGAFGIPGLPTVACDLLDGLVLDNADKQAEETGDALLLSEFGATNDLDTIRRIVDGADAHMTSWQYWHYCECDDPTTQGPGQQGLIGDANLPPEGDNVNAAKLAVLDRPYPQLVAGTPESYSFDRDANRFELSYSTERAGGGGFADAPETEVYVPELHYPGGYDVDVEGAAIASSPGAATLRLIACSGVETVRTTVSSPGEGAGDGPDCAAPAAYGSPSSQPAIGAVGTAASPSCARLRAKLRRAKSKRTKRKLRKKLRRRGCAPSRPRTPTR